MDDETLTPLDQSPLAVERRRLLLEMSPEHYGGWLHQPVTAAYHQFLEDQLALWRSLAVDLLEGGAYRLNDPHEDRNPDVVRGKLLTLKSLRRITLTEIQGFYGQSAPDESESPDELQPDVGSTGG